MRTAGIANENDLERPTPLGSSLVRSRDAGAETFPRHSYLRGSGLGPENAGMRWILAGLYLASLIVCRAILYLTGVALPQRVVSQVGYSIAFLLVGIGAIKYLRCPTTKVPFSKFYQSKMWMWFFLVVVYLFMGLLVYKNDTGEVGKEVIGLGTIGIFLIIGGNDRFWDTLAKHLTYVFYVGALLVIFFYETPAVYVTTDFTMQASAEEISSRYIETVGYGLRPLISTGLFLGAFGLVRRRQNRWLRLFQVLALGIEFFCEAGLFKFRSSATIVGLTIVSVLILRPIYERRIRITMVLLLVMGAAIGLYYFSTTEAYQLLYYRFTFDTEREPMFESRNSELDAYLSQMGSDIIFGRGLGGKYDATAVYNLSSAYRWGALHYGILKFSLVGGIPFLLLYISFVAPAIRPQGRKFYGNDCNLTAALLFPAFLVRLCLEPVSVEAEALIMAIPSAMVFSRFSMLRTHKVESLVSSFARRKPRLR